MKLRSLFVAIVFAACTVGEDGPEPDVDADPDPAELDQIVELMVTAADSPSVNEPLAQAATADRDGDGIADALEELLLRRYRPFYKFSLAGDDDESYAPANPIAELENSQLKMMTGDSGTTDPLPGCGRDGDHHMVPAESLFSCRPDANFLVSQAKSTYCLNIANARYHGVSLSDAKANATGLYGHVSPTKIDGHAAYKIEYWQFFAFNNQNISLLGLGSFGDHEGDWTSVQLWFDRVLHRLVKIRYLIHGKEVTFNIPPVTPDCHDCTISVKGPNYNPDPGNFFKHQEAYSDNQAEFYIDDHRYKHVVVYIERGAHEVWPGPWGFAETTVGFLTFKLNPHNGKGTSYLVRDVQDRVLNLGEVDHPLTRAGKFILQYAGYWGCTNTGQVLSFGPQRRSPIGPAMHCEWTWPDRGPVENCEH